MSKGIPQNNVKSQTVIAQSEHCDEADAKRTKLVDLSGLAISPANPLSVFTSFIRNGIAQQVTEDTADPSNNRPLPVKITNITGDVIIEPDNLNLNVQNKGEYDGPTNDNPDSIGIVAHERSAATDETHQTRRPTAIRGTGSDSSTVSQDIALHDDQGQRYNLANPLFTAKGGRNPAGTFTEFRHDGLEPTASTTTPLGSGGTFVSPIMNLTDYTNIASSIISDQDGSLLGEWFADAAGTIPVRTFTAPYSAAGGDILQSTPKLADYLRITYTNGSVAQTTFAFQFWKLDKPTGGQVSPLEAFLPTNILTQINRSIITGRNPFGVYKNVGVTNFSHLNSALNDSNSGASAFVAPNGSLNVAEIFRLVGGNFVAGQALLSHIWTENLINNGTTATPNGELVMSTGTTANGEVRIQSFRRSRFITATFNLSHQAVSTPNRLNTDVIRRWGVFNPDDASQDGSFFENDGGFIRIVRMKNNVREEVVELADFNGQDTFLFNDDISVYEIIYNAGTLFFVQNRKVIHFMESLDTAAYGTPHLRIGHSIQNINGNTTDNTLITRGSSVSRIGANSAIPDFFNITTPGTFTIKNNPGRVHRVIIGDHGMGATTLAIFNSTTGTGELISTLDMTEVQGVSEINVEFDTGLTIVATGNGIDITIIFD